MKFETTLHLSKNKKIACFYISKIHEKEILKFKGVDSVVTCLDFKPPIKFMAKLGIETTNNYVKYLYHIPKRYISVIISPIREYYKIDVTQF